MLRIDRLVLNEAVEALCRCAASARTVDGFRVQFFLDPKKAEAAILGALSIVAPNGGPATAADVSLVTMSGGSFQSWPVVVNREQSPTQS